MKEFNLHIESTSFMFFLPMQAGPDQLIGLHYNWWIAEDSDPITRCVSFFSIKNHLQQNLLTWNEMEFTEEAVNPASRRMAEKNQVHLRFIVQTGGKKYCIVRLCSRVCLIELISIHHLSQNTMNLGNKRNPFSVDFMSFFYVFLFFLEGIQYCTIFSLLLFTESPAVLDMCCSIVFRGWV